MVVSISWGSFLGVFRMRVIVYRGPFLRLHVYGNSCAGALWEFLQIGVPILWLLSGGSYYLGSTLGAPDFLKTAI